jgi:hypothetical protein
MTNMDSKKYIHPHELIFNKSNNIFKHNLTKYVNIDNDGNYKIELNLNKHGEQNIIGCKNMVLIFDVITNDIIDDNQITSLISSLTFQINGHDIGYLYDNHVIFMMLKYYGLEIEQIGSKIYFPIPLSLFQNGFVPYYFNYFTLLFKINNQNLIYNKITVNIEIFCGELNFNQKYLSYYQNNYWNKMINSLNFFDKPLKKSFYEIIKLDNLIFFGHEFSELIKICQINLNSNLIFVDIPIISNKISELFFFLVNDQTNQIVTKKFFNDVTFEKRFLAINQIVTKKNEVIFEEINRREYEIEYEELVYDLMISNKKFSEGFYRIPFENIYSNKLVMNENLNIYTVIIKPDKNIDFTNHTIHFYGLYDYKINLITDNKNSHFKFRSYYDMQNFKIYN